MSQNFFFLPEFALDVILAPEQVPHELLLLLRGDVRAARVELLVQEVHNAHVVVDVELVEERLTDLERYISRDRKNA